MLTCPAMGTELANVLETKQPVTTSKYKFKTSFEWVQRSTIPAFHDPEEPDVSTESMYGIRFKIKKQKLSFRLSSLHEYNGDAVDGMPLKQGLGDAQIRYVDSRFKGFLYDTDLIMTHKVYIPTRQRSIERKQITAWKGWFLVNHHLGPNWYLIGNFIPTAFVFQKSSYTPAGEDEAKANALYDIYTTAQLLYTFTDEFLVSAEFGWARREYLRFEDETRRDDTLPFAISMNYIYSDDLELALTLTSDNPTDRLKFNRITPFPAEYTSVVFETSLAVF